MSSASDTVKDDGEDQAHSCFEDAISKINLIVLCARWYVRYCLTLRDLEVLMAERHLQVDHSTIGRWVLRNGPELYNRIRRDVRLPNRSWRVDETPIKVASSPTHSRISTPGNRPPTGPGY